VVPVANVSAWEPPLAGSLSDPAALLTQEGNIHSFKQVIPGLSGINAVWYHSEATGEAMAKFDIVFEGGGAKGAAFAGALEVLFTAGHTHRR